MEGKSLVEQSLSPCIWCEWPWSAMYPLPPLTISGGAVNVALQRTRSRDVLSR